MRCVGKTAVIREKVDCQTIKVSHSSVISLTHAVNQRGNGFSSRNSTDLLEWLLSGSLSVEEENQISMRAQALKRWKL